MSRLPTTEHVAVFAEHGVCIVENFAPYLFCGADAVSQWEHGFRAHVGNSTNLAASFGPAQDFSTSGDRAYFSLPTTWTGIDSGKPFVEHGAWAFVLQKPPGQREPEKWRILSYGWGVTDFTTSP